MAESKKISQETRTMFVNENDYVLLITDIDGTPGNRIAPLTAIKKILSGGDKQDYVIVSTEDESKKCRVYINSDGKLYTIEENSLIEENGYKEGDNLAPPLTITQSTVNTVNNTALVINQIYGGGKSVNVETPISHNFIELYNNSDRDIDLNGLYLYYKDNENVWDKLKLRGKVLARTSFLIRGRALYNINSDMVRVKIKQYDQEWDKSFSDRGFSAYLCIGGDRDPESSPKKYTADTSSGKTVITFTNQRWVDCLGAGGVTEGDTVFAYEGNFYNFGMDKDHTCRRIKFFSGTGNNVDSEIINYKTCDINRYRPRSSHDGVWDSASDELQFDMYKPNMVNMTYGKDGQTTRIFTFQTRVSEEGYVRYRRQYDELWKEVETDRTIVTLHSNEVTIHRCIIHDLTAGVYEYQVGFEGCWTDIYTFEMKEYNETQGIKILWTSDEQGWTEQEYDATKEAQRGMMEQGFYNNVDFHLNTGDISQNADRPFEWRYYFKHNKNNLRTIPHMTTCGNNDLIEKKFGTAFTYYSTYEDQPLLSNYNPIVGADSENGINTMVSTYSFDLGFTHFICLNSNTEYMYSGVSTEQFLQKQCSFLDSDLEEVASRIVQPRWIVVYMHLSPFSIVRTKRLQKFIPVFEKWKVDLVLCGHNHTYSRSIPIRCGYDGKSAYNDYVTKAADGSNQLKIVDEYKDDTTKTEKIDRSSHKGDGTYYIMMQSTGIKLSGKEVPIILPSGMDLEHYSESCGNSPWWYNFNGVLPTQPSFGILDITWDKIRLQSYYIRDIVAKNDKKEITINKYQAETNIIERFDDFTMKYSDREK